MDQKKKKSQFGELQISSRLLAPTAASKAKYREKLILESNGKPKSLSADQVRQLIENGDQLPEGLNEKQISRFVKSLEIQSFINRAKEKLKLKEYDQIRDRLFRVIEEESYYDNPNDKQIVTFIKEGENVSILKQVNVEMYTDTSIKERKLLAGDDEIIFHIHLWWMDIKKNENDKIDKDTYTKFSSLIYDLLVPDGNDIHKEQITEDDWLRDAEGNDEMDEIQFSQSLFQMADIWSSTNSKEEYINFLTQMHIKVSNISINEKKWDIMKEFHPGVYSYQDFINNLTNKIEFSDPSQQKNVRRIKKEPKQQITITSSDQLIEEYTQIIEEENQVDEEDEETQIILEEEPVDENEIKIKKEITEIEENIPIQNENEIKIDKEIKEIEEIEEELIPFEVEVAKETIESSEEIHEKKIWKSNILDGFEDIPDLSEKLEREKREFELLQAWRREREKSLEALKSLEQERLQQLLLNGGDADHDTQLQEIRDEISRVMNEIEDLRNLNIKKRQELEELRLSKKLLKKNRELKELKDTNESKLENPIRIPKERNISNFISKKYVRESDESTSPPKMDRIPVDRARFMKNKESNGKKSPRIHLPMKVIVANHFLEKIHMLESYSKKGEAVDSERLAFEKQFLKPLKDKLPTLQYPTSVKVGVSSSNRHQDSIVGENYNFLSIEPNQHDLQKNDNDTSVKMEFPGFLPVTQRRRSLSFNKVGNIQDSLTVERNTKNMLSKSYDNTFSKKFMEINNINTNYNNTNNNVIPFAENNLKFKIQTNSLPSQNQNQTQNQNQIHNQQNQSNDIPPTKEMDQIESNSIGEKSQNLNIGIPVTSAFKNPNANQQTDSQATLNSFVALNLISSSSRNYHHLNAAPIKTTKALPVWNFGLRAKGKKFHSPISPIL